MRIDKATTNYELAPLKPLLAPKYWPSWLLVGLLWLFSRLPFAWGMAICRSLKPLLKLALKKRASIAEQNIRACFPSMDDAAVDAMLDQHFAGLASMVGEIIYSWWGSKALFDRIGTINGLEHIEAAKAAGHGVVLITIHTTCMEIGGHILAMQSPLHALYRSHGNPVMDRVSRKARLKSNSQMIAKRELRKVVKLLNSKGTIWYTTDLDVKNQQSLFVPFFGIPASTLDVPVRLAKKTGAVLIPMVSIREPGNRYRIEVLPPLENTPSDDMQADLGRINAVNEKMVLMAPDQYWWIHRRFKTRPPGEPPFYSN